MGVRVCWCEGCFCPGGVSCRLCHLSPYSHGGDRRCVVYVLNVYEVTFNHTLVIIGAKLHVRTCRTRVEHVHQLNQFAALSSPAAVVTGCCRHRLLSSPAASAHAATLTPKPSTSVLVRQCACCGVSRTPRAEVGC